MVPKTCACWQTIGALVPLDARSSPVLALVVLAPK